jgi:hypothetical protein
MSNEITTQQPQPPDNFRHYDPTVQGADGDDSRSGTSLKERLKYTNEATWEDTNGTDFTGKHLLAVDVRRTEVKWGDGVPVEVIELGPGERYRDLDAVNEATDRSEWREGPDGKLQGPWQRQHVLELIDIATMAAYSWPTSTVGGSIAIRELIERIQRMRRFRGENVYPAVELTHKHMKTRFGGRERPHLEVCGWYRVGEHGVEVANTPARPALTKIPTQPPLQAVHEPSRKEELNDEIGF